VGGVRKGNPFTFTRASAIPETMPYEPPPYLASLTLAEIAALVAERKLPAGRRLGAAADR
jgi:hypothetical protein